MKRENRKFHVMVAQRRQRNVQKSVLHVHSCSFADPWFLSKPIAFFAVLVAVAVLVA